jgi:hypothetical protein
MSDMTEEHLIAAWILGAFHRQRKPDAGLRGSFVGPGQMRLSPDEPISTAKVVCRSCNNEWLSVVDNAAADVLKSLIRGSPTFIPVPGDLAGNRQARHRRPGAPPVVLADYGTSMSVVPTSIGILISNS